MTENPNTESIEPTATDDVEGHVIKSSRFRPDEDDMFGNDVEGHKKGRGIEGADDDVEGHKAAKGSIEGADEDVEGHRPGRN